MKIRDGEGDPRAILIILPGGMAELLQSTPMLDALGVAYPGASIDYLCERPFDQVLLGHPRLRDVLTFDANESTLFSHMRQRLRGRYDLLIDLSEDLRFATLSRLSSVPTRIGRCAHLSRLFYNRVVPAFPTENSTLHERFAAFLPLHGGTLSPDQTGVFLSQRERGEGKRILEDRGVPGGSIALLPGAEGGDCEWPAEYFVRLAALIRMESEHDAVFIAQPGKRDRLERIRELSNSQISILPECGIRTLAGILINCRALVTQCCGEMHLALALNLPTLALGGGGDPRIEFPYSFPHGEILSFNTDRAQGDQTEYEKTLCFEELSPEMVFTRLRDLLERAPAP